jgi:hypothetical protein
MGMLLVGFFIGLIAAALEILMVRTYQKNKVILSAIGIHWIGVGGLTPFIDFGTPIWVKGILIGVISTLPFIVLEIQKSRNAVIHTSIFAPVWGVVIAYGCNLFA